VWDYFILHTEMVKKWCTFWQGQQQDQSVATALSPSFNYHIISTHHQHHHRCSVQGGVQTF
jgi:hypothetical protein